MPVTEVPPLPDDPEVKDLRLALVCYGGVSLAIYMHGITKEIHRLAVASKAFETDPSASPFADGTIEDVYWDALAERARLDGGVRTRVVVDIVAGTSAGGINGIILAKAIGRNLSQDSLRNLWLTKGDIKKLLALPRVPGLPLKLAAWAARLPFGKGKPPLDGKRMYGWVVEALAEMDASRQQNGAPPTLLPEGHPLELRVPITDFYGYDRSIPTFDPKRVTDRWHRHVMRFRSRDGAGELEPAFNERLAFAARATSCFPVAFPPVAVEDLGTSWAGPRLLPPRLLPALRARGRSARVDGVRRRRRPRQLPVRPGLRGDPAPGGLGRGRPAADLRAARSRRAGRCRARRAAGTPEALLGRHLGHPAPRADRPGPRGDPRPKPARGSDARGAREAERAGLRARSRRARPAGARERQGRRHRRRHARSTGSPGTRTSA